MLHSRLLEIAEERGGPLLAFDTSSKVASLCAVGWLPGVVREWVLPAHVMPSEALVQGIADESETTGLSIAELRGLVVGLGPGSFTGLRVGLATAKGLAIGASIPVWGVSSLAVLSAGAPPGVVVVCSNALRGDWFCGAYDVSEEHAPRVRVVDAARTPAEFVDAVRSTVDGTEQMWIVGDVAEAAADVLGKAGLGAVVCNEAQPRVGPTILSLREAIAVGEGESVQTLAPRYMRLSEPERKLAAEQPQS